MRTIIALGLCLLFAVPAAAKSEPPMQCSKYRIVVTLAGVGIIRCVDKPAPAKARPKHSDLMTDVSASRRMGHRRHYARHWRVVRRAYVEHQAEPHRAWATVSVERDRPADCYGIQWCGCWLRHHFGLADRGLNLAINWARIGSPASPDSANVVVWRHHVGKLLAHEGGMILVQSGNDGGAVRTRWLSPRVLGGVVAWRRV